MKILFAYIILCFSYCVSLAQITITVADIAPQIANGDGSVNSLYTDDTTGFSNLLLKMDSPQVWDFTKFSFKPIDQISDSFSIPLYNRVDSFFISSTPTFKGETHKYRATIGGKQYPYVYTHIGISKDSFLIYGTSIGADTGINLTFEIYKPALVKYKLPFTYKDIWSGSYHRNPGIKDSSVQIGIISYYDITVDGYGTILVPRADSNNSILVDTIEALRVRTSIDFGGQIYYDWVTKDGVVFHQYAFDFDHIHYLEYHPASVRSDSMTLQIKNVLQSLIYSVNKPGVYSRQIDLNLSPNPANASTMLSYTLPESAQTRILLMDALGQNVKVLFDGRANIGGNDLRINANTLSNGTYFIQVTSGNFSAIQKLVVAK